MLDAEGDISCHLSDIRKRSASIVQYCEFDVSREILENDIGGCR